MGSLGGGVGSFGGGGGGVGSFGGGGGGGEGSLGGGGGGAFIFFSRAFFAFSICFSVISTPGINSTTVSSMSSPMSLNCSFALIRSSASGMPVRGLEFVSYVSELLNWFHRYVSVCGHALTRPYSCLVIYLSIGSGIVLPVSFYSILSRMKYKF